MTGFTDLVDPVRLEEVTAPKPRRLNVASGNHPSGSWGYDVDLWFPSDVKADARHLPFPDHTFTAAYLGHLLEHIPWGEMAAILGEVRRVMAPGAEVMAVGPCILKAIATRQPEWLVKIILSDPRTVDVKPGVHHAWTATEELTIEALKLGGFTDVEAVDVATVRRPEWPNPSQAQWQCAVRGINPG